MGGLSRFHLRGWKDKATGVMFEVALAYGKIKSRKRMFVVLTGWKEKGNVRMLRLIWRES
jgi:hypothetical protein